jgi:hypothetical protein
MSACAIDPATGEQAAILGAPGRRSVDLRPAAAAAIAAALAAAIQSFWIPLDADVSWLITVCERLLSGDRLYVDILEVNPPASVWLYLPLVWIAERLGARPEAIVAAAFVGAGLICVSATVRLASRLKSGPQQHWLAAALAFVALVLPMGLFAQREHAALLLALPALATLAVIADGKRVSGRTLYSSGIAAGLMIVIKPHFVLALVLPAAWAAWRRRSLSPLLPGIVAAAIPPTLYAIAVALLAKAYFDWLPVLVHTYVPRRSETWKVLVGPVMFPAAALALASLLRPRAATPLTWAWALGSAGFVLAALVQGKNYPNHWLPGAGLALAALLTILLHPQVNQARRAAVGAWTAALAFVELYSFTIRPDAALIALVQSLAPPAPSIIALSPQLTTGHPMARQVGGHWAGSRAALFIAAGAWRDRATDGLASKAYRDDLHTFVTDVERHSPDVVLVDVDSKDWLMGEPAIARVMAAYKRAAVVNETEVWMRATPIGRTAPPAAR